LRERDNIHGLFREAATKRLFWRYVMTESTSPKHVPAAKDQKTRADAGLGETMMAAGGLGERDSVDRIRDILFGAQVRQYDQKFALVEEMIGKEVAGLRDETRKAVENLENFTKKGLESIVAQLKAEQAERADALNDLSAKLENLNKNIEKKIARLDEKANTGQHDLQEQILQQSKTLTQEIQKINADISAALRKAVDELRKEKTDRLALGNLFAEVGLRLKEEFKFPEVK
jgi:hypothetical protein